MKIEFTEAEIETIKNIIEDWGFEYSLKADTEKVDALAQKLNMDCPWLKIRLNN